jgi:signal transduction histidine kinase
MIRSYLAPLLAGLVLFTGIGYWTGNELEGYRERHRKEVERFAEGLFLSLDVSLAYGGPPPQMGAPRIDPRSHDRVQNLDRLRPTLQRLIDAHPKVSSAAVLRDGEVVISIGKLEPKIEISTSFGRQSINDFTFVWRPLPLAPAHHRPGIGPGQRPDNQRQERLPGQRADEALAPSGRFKEPPPGVPIVMMGVDSTLPDEARRRERLELAQTIGVASLGVIAMLAAWIQGIRRRALASRLQVEAAHRGHSEELSLAASGLAHETKNPLGIIRGLAQQIEQDNRAPQTDRDRAAQIQEEADRAVGYLGDFISYARSQEPQTTAVGVRTALEKAVAVLAADIESAGVKVTIETPAAHIVADQKMLLQILLNLLLNSLEACQAGNSIHIRFSIRGRRGRLLVTDDGRGIEPELLAQVLKPYVTGRSDGHGLGLAIVKRMVEQHGWSITISSEPGIGTRVAITGFTITTNGEESHGSGSDC